MGVSKQLKKTVFAVILIALLASGTYFAAKSTLQERDFGFNSRHKRSDNSQNTNNTTSIVPLTKLGKASTKIDAKTESQSSNPGKNIQATLDASNHTKKNGTDHTESSTTVSIDTPPKVILNATGTTQAPETATSTGTTTSTKAVNSSDESITGTSTPTPSIDSATTSAATPTESPTPTASSTTSDTTTGLNQTPASSTATSRGQLLNETTSSTSLNDTVTSTSNGTLSDRIPDKGGLSPTLAAIVGLGCGLVFFVMIYAVFKLIKNFKTFRFRRLHEMPMDDFDDYSGVYVEHTVPIRG